MPLPENPPEPVAGFVDDYRVRALWFARDDFYPEDDGELLWVIEQVEKHGDLVAFKRAARLRQWLSHRSNAKSAG